MKLKNYLISDKNNKTVGVITIYRFVKFNKLTKFELKEKSRVLSMLKKEQFENLDNLIDDTLEQIENMMIYSTNSVEKLKLQNKFSGLQNLKRKIHTAKNEYLKNPTNQLAFNKIINLYNSSKNFL